MQVYLTVLKDENEIRGILLHENLYKRMNANPVDKLDENLELSVCTYLKVVVDNKTAGLFCMQRIQKNAFIAHVGFYKKYYGYPAYLGGIKFLELCKNAFEYCTLYAFIPETRNHIKKYAERIGFQFITVLPKSTLIDGELKNQFLLQFSA
jgi:hypothetical protein